MSNSFKTLYIIILSALMVLSFVISIVIRKQSRELRMADENEYPRINKRILLLTSISVIILLSMVVLSIYFVMYYLNK